MFKPLHCLHSLYSLHIQHRPQSIQSCGATLQPELHSITAQQLRSSKAQQPRTKVRNYTLHKRKRGTQSKSGESLALFRIHNGKVLCNTN